MILNRVQIFTVKRNLSTFFLFYSPCSTSSLLYLVSASRLSAESPPCWDRALCRPIFARMWESFSCNSSIRQVWHLHFKSLLQRTQFVLRDDLLSNPVGFTGVFCSSFFFFWMIDLIWYTTEMPQLGRNIRIEALFCQSVKKSIVRPKVGKQWVERASKMPAGRLTGCRINETSV